MAQYRFSSSSIVYVVIHVRQNEEPIRKEDGRGKEESSRAQRTGLQWAQKQTRTLWISTAIDCRLTHTQTYVPDPNSVNLHGDRLPTYTHSDVRPRGRNPRDFDSLLYHVILTTSFDSKLWRTAFSSSWRYPTAYTVICFCRFQHKLRDSRNPIGRCIICGVGFIEKE